MLLPLSYREVSVSLCGMRKFVNQCIYAERSTEIFTMAELWVLPVEMSYKEAQGPVVGCRQLLEKVSDLENDSVELDARPAFLSCLGAVRFISFLHNHSLALFSQANNIVVVSIQDQWLW